MILPKVHPDWWKFIFDELYLQTDGRSVCDTELTSKEVDFIESSLCLDRSAVILDLCGGQGRHALELSRRGYKEVTVLDYSDYLIQAGRQEAARQDSNIRFLQGDARDTQLPSETYDSVMIMGGSFGYFVEPVENEKILKEVFRILNSGGVLLLDLPDEVRVRKNFQPISQHQPDHTLNVVRNRELKEDIIYCQEIITCAQRGVLRENTYCIRLYRPDEIRRILEQVGFTHVSFQEDFMNRQQIGDYGTMTNRMVVRSRK